MAWKRIRLAHEKPARELFAGLSLVFVFWIIMHIEGYLYLEGINTFQTALIHFLALIVSLLVADQIGHISYVGVALIVMVGITGYLTTDYYIYTVRNGRAFSFAPLYAYIFPSLFACWTMWWIRRVKLYLAEQRAARN